MHPNMESLNKMDLIHLKSNHHKIYSLFYKYDYTILKL